MAIKKKYSKDKKVCRITFIISKEMCEDFNVISVVGDFNNWDPNKHKLSQRNSNGSASIELVLKTGKEYQFRYLCDRQIWLNEPEADKQIITHYGDSENSVLII